MIPYFEKNKNLIDKYEYLNELNATLSITLEIIESEVKELKISNESVFESQISDNQEDNKSAELEQILEIINRIKSSLERNYHMRKEKFSCNSKLLLANLVKEEKVREKKELIEENQRQINFLENIIEDKKMLMIQAEDSFGEFEKHFTMIRVIYPEYSLFDIRHFIEENCRLVRQKDKKYIRLYLIKDAIQNKTDEIKEYKIFLRSLDLWKGIQIENSDGNNFTTNTKAITLLQEGCQNLLNSISTIEMNVLNLSVIFVGWLSLVSEYQFDKKKATPHIKKANKDKIQEKSSSNMETNAIVNNNNDKEIILSSEANSNKFHINSVRSELVDSNSLVNQDRKKDEKKSESYNEAIQSQVGKNSKDTQSGYCESIKMDENTEKKDSYKNYVDNEEKKLDELNLNNFKPNIDNYKHEDQVECDEILTTKEIENLHNNDNKYEENQLEENENNFVKDNNRVDECFIENNNTDKLNECNLNNKEVLNNPNDIKNHKENTNNIESEKILLPEIINHEDINDQINLVHPHNFNKNSDYVSSETLNSKIEVDEIIENYQHIRQSTINIKTEITSETNDDRNLEKTNNDISAYELETDQGIKLKSNLNNDKLEDIEEDLSKIEDAHKINIDDNKNISNENKEKLLVNNNNGDINLNQETNFYNDNKFISKLDTNISLEQINTENKVEAEKKNISSNQNVEEKNIENSINDNNHILNEMSLNISINNNENKKSDSSHSLAKIDLKDKDYNIDSIEGNSQLEKLL
jgi:hypothetical protein